MINQLQNLSIKLLNSNYKILFTIFIYGLIYSFFYIPTISYCMTTDVNEIDNSYIKEIERLNHSLEERNKTLSDLCKNLIEREQVLHSEVSTLIQKNRVIQLELTQTKTQLAELKESKSEITQEAKSIFETKETQTLNKNELKRYWRDMTELAEGKSRLNPYVPAFVPGPAGAKNAALTINKVIIPRYQTSTVQNIEQEITTKPSDIEASVRLERILQTQTPQDRAGQNMMRFAMGFSSKEGGGSIF